MVKGYRGGDKTLSSTKNLKQIIGDEASSVASTSRGNTPVSSHFPVVDAEKEVLTTAKVGKFIDNDDLVSQVMKHNEELNDEMKYATSKIGIPIHSPPAVEPRTSVRKMKAQVRSAVLSETPDYEEVDEFYLKLNDNQISGRIRTLLSTISAGNHASFPNIESETILGLINFPPYPLNFKRFFDLCDNSGMDTCRNRMIIALIGAYLQVQNKTPIAELTLYYKTDLLYSVARILNVYDRELLCTRCKVTPCERFAVRARTPTNDVNDVHDNNDEGGAPTDDES